MTGGGLTASATIGARGRRARAPRRATSEELPAPGVSLPGTGRFRTTMGPAMGPTMEPTMEPAMELALGLATGRPMRPVPGLDDDGVQRVRSLVR